MAKQNRKQFILENNATCKNWNWSWSFVNHDAKIVIFGAWDVATRGTSKIILNEDWVVNKATQRKNNGYPEALEYIRLVEQAGYRLQTFPMTHSLVDPKVPDGHAKIRDFEPVLSDAQLTKDGKYWLALPLDGNIVFSDEIGEAETDAQIFSEGKQVLITVSATERSAKARAECLKLKGYDCSVCEINFGRHFGEIGVGFIHVHHLNQISEKKGEYQIKPLDDLVPVCPNCHAMLHRKTPPYSVEQMKAIISAARKENKQ
ncbi:HNH endonuclease [Vannielia litorea]|uniref:5-methylcytosine-specific restriction enzyme A n=1 Tax=Vannielia litorea TaxID=1217970 RepID=A0A1N6GRI4_9RHOB|nr:HNH endonuclease [Vannielia litorea]SIO09985.1 5-methylcytosine-specific restriction enzyme A [Vannielia litorea]